MFSLDINKMYNPLQIYPRPQVSAVIQTSFSGESLDYFEAKVITFIAFNKQFYTRSIYFYARSLLESSLGTGERG